MQIENGAGIGPIVAKLAPYAPALAGAVLSLAFVENLTPRGRIICVAVGLASAMFLAPALAALADLFWPGELPTAISSGLQFLVSLCAMGCLPALLGFLRRLAGNPLALASLIKGDQLSAEPKGEG